MKYRVLIVDDHPIVRQGMRLMIDAEPDLIVCGEAQTEQEARAQVRELPRRRHRRLSLEHGDGFNVVRESGRIFRKRACWCCRCTTRPSMPRGCCRRRGRLT